jgi:hypothetical protein
MPRRERFHNLLKGARAAARWCFALIVFPFLAIILPIAIPFLFISEALEKRRWKAVAEQFDCSRCGNRLGRRAVEAAIHGKYHAAVGFASNWACAICLAPDCGAMYAFCKELNSFVLIAATDSSADEFASD